MEATIGSLEETLKNWPEKMAERVRQRDAKIREELKNHPQTVTCQKHNRTLAVSFELSRTLPIERIELNGPAYEPCPACLAEQEKAKRDKRHLKMGIPPLLLDATLEQLAYDSENDRKNLEKVKKWVTNPRGFLMLLGGVGVGKSHIGAAILMQRGVGLFVTQNGLLQKLRETYKDRSAEDFVEKAKETDLLILDEVGVSVGGKDEYPMMHEIIDHRYQHMLPMVITSNLDAEGFKGAMGDRIADRIRQASAAILRFCDASKRQATNGHYLDMASRVSIKLDREEEWDGLPW